MALCRVGVHVCRWRSEATQVANISLALPPKTACSVSVIRDIIAAATGAVEDADGMEQASAAASLLAELGTVS